MQERPVSTQEQLRGTIKKQLEGARKRLDNDPARREGARFFKLIAPHIAVVDNDQSVLKDLIAEKTDINIQGIADETPLQLAVLFGHTEIFKVLLDSKADISVLAKNGCSPCGYVAKFGNVEMLKALFGRKVYQLHPNEIEPILLALNEGYLVIAKTLLQKNGYLIDKGYWVNIFRAIAKQGYLHFTYDLFYALKGYGFYKNHGEYIQASEGILHSFYAKILNLLRQSLPFPEQEDTIELLEAERMKARRSPASQDKEKEAVFPAANRSDGDDKTISHPSRGHLPSPPTESTLPNDALKFCLAAARMGQFKKLNKLLGHFTKTEVLQEHFTQLLSFAAVDGRIKVAKQLLACKETFGLANANDVILVDIACYVACKNAIRFLRESFERQPFSHPHIEEVGEVLQGFEWINEERQQSIALRQKKAMNDWQSIETAGFTELHHAVYANNRDNVKTLLKKNVPLDALSKQGLTALHIAAATGRDQIVELLCEAKANLHSRCGLSLDVYTLTNYGATPLYMAAAQGHTHIVAQLIRYQADIHRPHYFSKTPLYAAAEKGHLETVAFLLCCKAKVDAQQIEHEVYSYRWKIDEISGYHPLVCRLYHYWTNRDLAHSHSTTPLWAACKNQHSFVADVLIAAKADVNTTFKGETVLHSVMSKNSFLLAEKLLKAGADPNGGRGGDHQTTLMIAAKLNNSSLVRALLEAKADAKKVLAGKSALSYAREANCRSLIKQFLQTPSLFSEKTHNTQEILPLDKKMSGALYRAVENGKIEEVMSLLSGKGAAYLKTEENGNIFSPLYAAAATNHVGIAALLIQYGASINLKAGSMSPVFDFVVASGNMAMTTLLLKAGANPNAQQKGSLSTPLHVAVANRAGLGVVKCLLDYRANPGVRNKQQQTPLCIAKELRQLEVTIYLQEYCLLYPLENQINHYKKGAFQHRAQTVNAVSPGRGSVKSLSSPIAAPFSNQTIISFCENMLEFIRSIREQFASCSDENIRKWTAMFQSVGRHNVNAPAEFCSLLITEKGVSQLDKWAKMGIEYVQSVKKYVEWQRRIHGSFDIGASAASLNLSGGKERVSLARGKTQGPLLRDKPIGLAKSAPSADLGETNFSCTPGMAMLLQAASVAEHTVLPVGGVSTPLPGSHAAVIDILCNAACPSNRVSSNGSHATVIDLLCDAPAVSKRKALTEGPSPVSNRTPLTSSIGEQDSVFDSKALTFNTSSASSNSGHHPPAKPVCETPEQEHALMVLLGLTAVEPASLNIPLEMSKQDGAFHFSKSMLAVPPPPPPPPPASTSDLPVKRKACVRKRKKTSGDNGSLPSQQGVFKKHKTRKPSCEGGFKRKENSKNTR